MAIPKVDFLNIDIEGLDTRIIETIDLDRYKIDLILFENNNSSESSKNELEMQKVNLDQEINNIEEELDEIPLPQKRRKIEKKSEKKTEKVFLLSPSSSSTYKLQEQMVVKSCIESSKLHNIFWTDP